MNTTAIKAIAAIIVAAACPLIAHADATTIKQLPRVVITGKSQPVTSTTQTIVQLPRVVIEGRRSSLMALNSATPSEARRA